MGVQQQLLSGLFFIAFGALAIWAGSDLTIGTASDMGIGYTPRALAIGCVVIGCLLLAQAYLASPGGESMPVAIAWRPLALVTLMVVSFGVFVPYLGLPITVVLMTVMAAMSGERFSWMLLGAMALGMAVLSLLLFSMALNLQIPVWPF